MKAAFILAAAGAAMAQNLSGEPACATSCLVSAISAAGCGPSDLACQCGPTQTAIAAAAGPCLIGACNAADLGVAISVGSAFCVAFSATATASVTSTSSGGPTVTPPTTSKGSSSTTAAPTVVTTKNSTVTTHKPSPTTTSTSQSTNAAATPIAMGVGAVAAFLGLVAAL